VPVDKLRVVSRDVGGAFGMRTSGYPPDYCKPYPDRLFGVAMLPMFLQR
jgi:CO/xanthine dehydrogenase Mo-binding subunit